MWTDWAKEPITRVEQRALFLREAGYTYVKIAQQMKISKSLAHNIVRRAKMKVKARRELDED